MPSPSRNSMTMKRSPLGSSPMSRISRMWSLPILPAACASRSKRRTTSASWAIAAWSNLMATRRCKRRCSPAKTAPMPPSPIIARTRYLPSMTCPISTPIDTSRVRRLPCGVTWRVTVTSQDTLARLAGSLFSVGT